MLRATCGPMVVLAGWAFAPRMASAAAAADDSIDRVSLRPDFPVPVYSGGVHDTIPQAAAETLPTLLICAVDDRDDVSSGLADLYLAMKKAGAPSSGCRTAASSINDRLGG